MAWRIGVDIGGTFTDVVLVDEGDGSHRRRQDPDHVLLERRRGAITASQTDAELTANFPAVRGNTGKNRIAKSNGFQKYLYNKYLLRYEVLSMPPQQGSLDTVLTLKLIAVCDGPASLLICYRYATILVP